MSFVGNSGQEQIHRKYDQYLLLSFEGYISQQLTHVLSKTDQRIYLLSNRN